MGKIAYLVKYALTGGVSEVDVEGFKQMDNGYLLGKWGGDGDWCATSFKEGRDFTYCLDEAKVMFERMREKKIESLIKQQKKLHQTHFKVKTVVQS